MAVTEARPALRPGRGVDLTPRRTWGPAHYLAAFGAVLVFYIAWTWGTWLLDGPTQITAYRDTDSVAWYAARGYEVAACILAVILTTGIVRACRRERRITLDGMIAIGGAFTYFWDPIPNWIMPNFMYSSNWLNLNDWTDHAPFVINPDAGRLPEPVLFIGLTYTFGLLFFAIVLNALMRAARRRRPSISNAKLVGVAALGAFGLDIALEGPMFLLHLWGLPGAPAEFALFGGNSRFPPAEFIPVTMVFTGWACLRFFKNDKGEAITERGLVGLSPGRRTVVSVLATIAVCNSLLLVLGLVQITAGFFADPYPRYPVHMVNDLCDAPGVEGTRYGPCPGSPGFRAPGRDALPGSKPYTR
ncbi:MAG: spirocyclase AveC family protein [Acidimicrobiia bacterium]